MTGRNRASGWQYAKLSGHKNEDRVKNLLDTEKEYCAEFLQRIECSDKQIKNVTIGGLHETNVDGVLNHTTKSKTDLKLKYTDNSFTNVSIKKSLGGQVYLVKVGTFIQVFEKQFDKRIPEKVKRAMQLFWAEAEDATSIIQNFAYQEDFNSYSLQLKHKSLNANTLFNYDKDLYDDLLNWFCDNSYELAKMSFSMGAAKNKEDWSDYVWYINLMGDLDIDEVYCIDKICEGSRYYAKQMTFFGDKNGGTTIQLPFGFVQWHQKQMQFHHLFEKVAYLASK